MNASDLACLTPSHPWQTPRWRRLDFLWRLFSGKQYDHLPHMFCEEKGQQGDYVPLKARRPSVRYRLPRIVTKKSVSMLFAGRNWPQVSTDDQDFTDWLDTFFRRHHFPVYCTRVATMGSIGSVVPVFRYNPTNRVLTLDVWNARDCTPTFDTSGILRRVTLKYLTSVDNLRLMGIPVDPKLPANQEMWYRRELDSVADVIYTPTLREDWNDLDPEVAAKIVPLKEFSYTHDLGFIPACWVRNLPTDDFDDASIDGSSTYECMADFVLEIDYLLSQGGRGLRYNSDPQLFWKDPMARPDGAGQMSLFGPQSRATNAPLIGSEKSDAKLLEMSGNGQKVTLDWVRELRNLALEVARASRKDPQKSLSNAASGKLAEILDEDVINLGAELRNSYGSEFLLEFARKIVLALQIYGVADPIIQGVTPEELDSIMLIWGPWFEPTSADHTQLQQALEAAVQGGRLDIKSARSITYADFGMAVPKTVDWARNMRIISGNERAKNAWRLEGAAITAGMGAAAKPTPVSGGKNADGTAKPAPKPGRIADPGEFGIEAVLPELESDITAEQEGDGAGSPAIDVVTEEVRRDHGGPVGNGADEDGVTEAGSLSDDMDTNDVPGLRYH